MDDVDKSDIQQQTLLDATIKRIQSMVTIPVNDTGVCLTCGEEVSDGRRWCDADCRDHYESQ